MFDLLLLAFFAIGMVLGYFRGAYAGIVLLLASYVPFCLFVYFYDFISGFVSDVFSNSGDGLTAALGGIGAFSGVVALVGFAGSMFFGTRLILKIMKTDRLEFPDKLGGAIVGMIGQNIAATLTFFLIYTAIPVKTTEVVFNSYWIKIMRPIHLATYPYYLDFLETRTQKLSVSIAQNGIGNTLVGGINLSSLNEGLGFDKPSLGEAAKAVRQLSQNINIDEISSLLETAKNEDVSPEAIDRRIKEEQAARLQAIQNQLN